MIDVGSDELAASNSAGSMGEPAAASGDPTRAQFHRRKGVRQFVKFCIVGSTSFLVNFVIFNVCLQKFHLLLVPALTIAFLVSVLNGFFWNRRWTFKEARHVSAADQGIKFLLVNIVGWFLNTGITVSLVAIYQIVFQHSTIDFGEIFLNILYGHKAQYGVLVANGALLGATAVVVFWNFFANRHWTFKH